MRSRAALADDVHAVARLQMSGVHADEHELSDKRIAHDLEGQCGERSVVFSFALNFLTIVRIDALNCRNVEWRREEVHHGVEQQGKFIRQTGGRGQYGHVKIRLEPNPGKGYEFENDITGGSVPRSTSSRSTTVSRRRSKAACWRATRWSI